MVVPTIKGAVSTHAHRTDSDQTTDAQAGFFLFFFYRQEQSSTCIFIIYHASAAKFTS